MSRKTRDCLTGTFHWRKPSVENRGLNGTTAIFAGLAQLQVRQRPQIQSFTTKHWCICSSLCLEVYFLKMFNSKVLATRYSTVLFDPFAAHKCYDRWTTRKPNCFRRQTSHPPTLQSSTCRVTHDNHRGRAFWTRKWQLRRLQLGMRRART